MDWLLPHPSPPSPVSKLDRYKKTEKEIQFGDGRRGKSQVKRRRVCVVLYISFNTLCTVPSSFYIPIGANYIYLVPLLYLSRPGVRYANMSILIARFPATPIMLEQIPMIHRSNL
jgi:hypothetical protein